MAFPDIGSDDGQEPIADRLGIAVAIAWGSSAEAGAARRGQLQRVRQVGFRRVRTDFLWHRVEPEPGEWDFNDLDALVADATEAQIRLLAILAYGNPLYSSESGGTMGPDIPIDYPPEVFYPPDDPAAYSRFVAAIVARYAPDVSDYELWNEENIGFRFFRPRTDAARYAGLAHLGAQAGRAECAACRFVLGGLSMPQPIPSLDLYPVGPEFLSDVYAAADDLDSLLDAVAFHPYQYPKDPPEFETAPFPDRFQGSLATQTKAVEDVVLAQDVSRPLWITEEGWPTNPGVPETDEDIARVFGIDVSLVALGREQLGDDFATLLETIRGVSEGDQARYSLRAVLGAMALGIEQVFLYTLDDFDIDPEINQESVFGLFRADGSEKPAAAALRELLAQYGEHRFVADVSAELGLGDSDRALAFRGESGPAIAFWRWSGSPGLVRIGRLPFEAAVKDGSGGELAGSDSSAQIEVPLGPDVVWLVPR